MKSSCVLSCLVRSFIRRSIHLSWFRSGGRLLVNWLARFILV